MSAEISPAYRRSSYEVFRYRSDKQNHFAAFDFNVDGKLSRKELAMGFEVLGNSAGSAKFKALFAKMFFGSDLSKVTSKGDGLYDKAGNVNAAKVHEIFEVIAKDGTLTPDNVDDVVSGYGFFDKMTKSKQYDSAFKIQDSYTEQEFVEMLKGPLLRKKFLERLAE